MFPLEKRWHNNQERIEPYQRKKITNTLSILFGTNMPDRDSTLRRMIKSLNGSISTLSNLERDPPIVIIANMERDNVFQITGLIESGKESIRVASSLNDYRREYWKLELLIKQAFIEILKKEGYLPGRSLEVESLRNALPEALIKGDGRIWIYSYDHYIGKISERVGRSPQNAPSGEEIWKKLESRFNRRMETLVEKVNRTLPLVFHLKSKLRSLIGHPELDLGDLNVRKPKISPVQRPITKVIVVRRPIPLPKKGKIPRKRILKRPKHQVVEPGDGG
jgi:hypothetical protein